MKKLLFGLLVVSASLSCICGHCQINVGAVQLERYLPLIKGKRVGLVVNQTSVVGAKHLVDTLKSLNYDLKYVFAPEHGFRGEAANGEHVKSEVDSKTGISVVSLYGKTKKPSSEVMNQLDIIVFDIQDVGARFYTYLSTLHYIIESCIEHNKPLIILDRPNPNGMYIQGPVLELKYKSFVGMHPIPILHGMTFGELAQMIVGERWVANDGHMNLKIITCEKYSHSMSYELPIRPSPNLPNQQAIMLYPSLCLFEATKVSVGRGTSFPFQTYGINNKQLGDFQFIPKTIKGFVIKPPFEDTICYGVDLRQIECEGGFTLKFILDAFGKTNRTSNFFSSPAFFDKLAGTSTLRQQIINGASEKEITQSWQPALDNFKKLREKYLLYP